MPLGCDTAARAFRSRRSPRSPSGSYPEGHDTIYLPSGGAALDEDGPTRAVRVDGPLDRDAIEAVVERETAVPDVFEHARLEVRRMDGTTR